MFYRILVAIPVIFGFLAWLRWFDTFHAVAGVLAAALMGGLWRLYRSRQGTGEETGPTPPAEDEPVQDGPLFADRLRDGLIGVIQGGVFLLVTAVTAAALAWTPVYRLCYDLDCNAVLQRAADPLADRARALDLVESRLQRPASGDCGAKLLDRSARLHIELAGQTSGDERTRHWKAALDRAKPGGNPDLIARINAGLEGDRQRREIAELKNRPQVALIETAEGYVVNLPDVFFATDQAQLTDKARPVIAEIVARIKEKAPGKAVRVAGHTDSTGSAAHNQTLSEQRAEAVREALTEAGLEGALVTAAGFGASQPVASNDTPEGRAQNRRVTITIAK